VGDELELRIIRDGRERDLRLRIGDAAQAMAEIPGEALPQLAGARVANIGPGMPLHGQIEAVVVTAAERGSPAFQNGLRRGDVIVAVGRARVRTVDELITALRNAEPPIRLALVRGDSRLGLIIR
jgi:serine protease Do/serine protease DegQ